MKHIMLSIFMLFGLTLSAQKMTVYENTLDKLLYHSNSYLLTYSECLSSMYEKTLRKQKLNPHSNEGCNHQTPWDEACINDSLFCKNLKTQHPEIAKALQSVNEVCKKVVTDLKLERLDEKALSAYFKDFELAALSLNSASQDFRAKWTAIGLKQLPKEISDYILLESQAYSNMRFQLRKNLNQPFPEETLRKNIEQTESLLGAAEFKAPQNQNLHSILYAINSVQENKKYFLNELGLDNQSSSKFYNDFAYQIHNHFNNGLLHGLAVHYKTPFAFFIPILPKDNQIAEDAKTRELRYKALNSEIFNAAVTHWEPKDADALGELTEALNEAVRKINQATEAIYSLKKDLDKKRAGTSKYVYLNYAFAMNEGDIEAALGRLKPRKNEAFTLINTQTQNVLTLLQDNRILFESMRVLVTDKEKIADNYSNFENLLKKYKERITDLDLQIKTLNENINKANAPKTGGTDNWSKTARALESYCLEITNELKVVEESALSGKKAAAYDFTKTENNYVALLEQELSLLAGIKKIGSSNGKCPYGIFEDVAENGLRFHKKALRYKDSLFFPYEIGCCDGYARVTHSYNEVIAYYNKFSLQGAERETDFAKYDHPVAVINKLLLNKVLLLPDMTLGPLSEKKDSQPKPAPTPIAVPEMTKEYIEKCKHNNIVFLVDVSTSMQGKDKLEHFRQDLHRIADFMRAEDLISIVSFEGKAVLQLKKTGVLDRKKWEKAIDNLKSSGGTHFADGIDFAYTYMKENLEKGYNNRILLVSDGEFEVSDNVKQMVENAAKDNQIVFSALIYNPKAEVYPKIQDLAKRAGGNYSLISSKSDSVPMLYLEFAVLK